MNADYQVEVKEAPVAPDPARLRVGVIGLGVGRMHIEGWQQHPNVDVVAIADPDEQRLAQIGETFGIATRYGRPEQMFAHERLDVVSICTPNKFHHALTLAAFEAGCHVLCEKPMAMNADEGRAMLAAARRAGKRLMINFSYRFSAQSRALKAQVDAGVFGEFYFGRTVWHRRRGMPGFGGWFGTRALAGGGPLIDLGVHRLDLALWLMGYPKPTWVMGSTYDAIARELAATSGKSFDVEDLAAALIRFDNGATLIVEASWAAHIGEAELMETRLLGTQAGLLHRNVDEGYNFDAHIFLDKNGAQFDMHLHPSAVPARSPMHDYAEAILNGIPHPAPGEEGLVVMEILDAIYASARSGEPVKV
ncbi:Gfo/Idh/MocA family protein [Piscinibacter sp.]|jgi:predicted dehydrogenase|uniref:Gfo/Idh/MocA family protein n=1 Tax=Piscinibacter sp. TaxID=1903157 RepID=UPI00355A4C64